MENDKLKAEKDKLRDSIWSTRISRVNAEKRLLFKDGFVNFVNIYYSCFNIFCSIVLLINDSKGLNMLNIFMSVSLLVSILYLNSLRYSERARDYRTNYTQLHKLELKLSAESISECELSKIKNEYCDLLNSSCNHITFDYYRTVEAANESYKKSRWEKIWWKYYLAYIWRILLYVTIIMVPILILIIFLFFRMRCV